MFVSRNKRDLIIEVWEKLDCESVGREEIAAIATALEGQFGKQAVDSPMVIARLLADEGADLRHPEIMGLYLERAEDRPYEPAFLNLLDTGSLKKALASLRRMENLRKKFVSDGDKEGLGLLRRFAIAEKDRLKTGEEIEREIAEWLTIWLGSPEVFENWIKLRTASADFIKRFGEI